MRRANRQLDWYVLEEENGDDQREDMSIRQTVPGTNNHVAESGAHRFHSLYELLVGIALFYGTGVYFLWQQAEQRMTGLEQEVTALHHQLSSSQHSAEQNRDDGKVVPVLEDSSDSHQFGTEYLWFEVSRRTIERMASAHIHYEAGERTVEAMYSVAAASDRRYRQLHQEFGLELPDSVNKLRIFVDHLPDGANGVSIYSHGQRVNYIFVPLSPAFTAQRHEITEIDVVTNDINRGLTDYVLSRAIESREIKPQWEAMTVALQLYLQRENGYNPNWRTHAVYLSHRHVAQNRSIDLVYQVIGQEVGTDDEWFRRTPTTYVVADPLIEFILATYGDAQIPLLLDAFERHDSWETFIPAEFGISATQFEEDWHLYLQQRYPLPEE